MNVASTALEVIIWWLWGFGLAFGYNAKIDTGFAGNNPAAFATSAFGSIKVD